jgi:SAM-dependent methyltransferase
MNPRHITYFNSQADLRRSFLHPGGRWATEKLLAMIPELDNESTVLEIGCGMGHTAALLLERTPAAYIGIDASPRMLENARNLLARFGRRATLHRCDLAIADLPVDSASVDVVYAESVVAIIDPHRVLKEVHRVLRNGGILLINDRIWSTTITVETRQEYNAIGRSLYGFPFAADDPGTASEWQTTLTDAGFDCYHTEPLDITDIPEEAHRMGGLTGWRKLLRGVTAPGALLQSYRDQRVGASLAHIWDSMESWLFCARKVD